MALDKETVAIPLTSGIKPSTRARLLEPTKLLVAQNSQFIQDQGPQKRNGHSSSTVRTKAAYPGLNGVVPPTAAPVRSNYDTSDPGLPSTWLYGWGIIDTSFAVGTDPFEVSAQPDAGQLFGVTSRDDEVLAWDGHRLFSVAPQQTDKFGETQVGTTRQPTTMPMLRSGPFAKIPDAQAFPDAADNGVVRAAAWLNSSGTTAGYSAFDSKSLSCLVFNSTITLVAPKAVRLISVGGWFHILISDTTANSLEMRSFHESDPGTLISRTFGTVDIQFDVKKIDETKFVVIKSKANVITAFVLNSDGSTINSFTPDLAGFAASTNLAICCDINLTGDIGLAWQTTGAPIVVNFRSYNQGGAALSARVQVTTIAGFARRMTLAPRFINSVSTTLWDVFVEDLTLGVKAFCVLAGTSSTLTADRRRVTLATHAIRVGNRTFVWCVNSLAGEVVLQPTWILMDGKLLPVGKLAYGIASPTYTAAFPCLQSINFLALAPFKDRIVFHGALGYNVRVPTQTSSLSPVPNGVFAEPSILFYEMDFLPKLVAGQAGRTTYFAGAQLWAYDGAETTEAGFHMAPEGVTGVASAGGSLSAGSYTYRVELCHVNAQGEEVRSWSIITPAVVAALNDKITLTIPQIPVTRREDAYFLIFRTQANGTIHTLVNSRNPTSASFLRNNLATTTFSYVDSLSDAAALVAEQNPGNVGGNFVFPLPAPACEIVAAGRDRLWLAGGELSSGEVAPSRLFFPGQTPSFNPSLNVQIDRNAEKITAIGFVGEIAAIFRRTSTYILDTDGPDNALNGAFSPARLAIADTGAVGPESLALTVVGLWFQSPAGIRLLNNNGAMDREAGLDVDPLATDTAFAAAVVVPQYSQVRWYSNDISKPSLVIDYLSNSWSTWTSLTAVGAVFSPAANLAVLGKGDGRIWSEEVGTYTDAGGRYEHIIRLAWLHAAQLGDFQRIRRFALFGNCVPITDVRIRLYYDERPFHDEEIIVQIPEHAGEGNPNDFNDALWGGHGTPGWGQGGAWGDEQNPENINGPESGNIWFRDGVFRFRRRPRRQKCSVFSVEFSDQGVEHAGFEPIVVALELARKKGLDRIPTGIQ